MPIGSDAGLTAEMATVFDEIAAGVLDGRLRDQPVAPQQLGPKPRSRRPGPSAGGACRYSSFTAAAASAPTSATPNTCATSSPLLTWCCYPAPASCRSSAIPPPSSTRSNAGSPTAARGSAAVDGPSQPQPPPERARSTFLLGLHTAAANLSQDERPRTSGALDPGRVAKVPFTGVLARFAVRVRAGQAARRSWGESSGSPSPLGVPHPPHGRSAS